MLVNFISIIVVINVRCWGMLWYKVPFVTLSYISWLKLFIKIPYIFQMKITWYFCKKFLLLPTQTTRVKHFLSASGSKLEEGRGISNRPCRTHQSLGFKITSFWLISFPFISINGGESPKWSLDFFTGHKIVPFLRTSWNCLMCCSVNFAAEFWLFFH